MSESADVRVEVLDAGLFSLPETITRFVPTLIWDRIRETHRHQLLYGGTGTGKTMILRRISWPAMLSAPDFRPKDRFIGFYYNAGDLEDLKTLYSPEFTPPDHSSNKNLKGAAAYFGTLHLLHSIADTLVTVDKEAEWHPELSEALLMVATTIFEVSSISRHYTSLGHLIDDIVDLKFKFMTSVAEPSRIIARNNLIHSIPPPVQVFRMFATRVLQRSEARIAILLDQYEWLPKECQSIFNPLLRRENSKLFFAVIASRPFAFDPASGVDGVQQSEDFDVTLAEYMPADHHNYGRLLADIWVRICPQRPPIETLLEGGLGLFADMSSRSIRWFLQLCREAGAFSHDYLGPISRAQQFKAVERISAILKDELKTAPGIPQGTIWRLVSALTRTTLNISTAEPTASRNIVLPASTSDDGDLSVNASTLLRRAFEEGAIQFSAHEDTSSLSLPKRFSVAPICGSALGRILFDGVAREIQYDLIEKVSREAMFSSLQPNGGRRPPSRLFLSVSFEENPAAETLRELFSQACLSRSILLREGSANGRGLITQLAQQIRESDASVVVLTHLKPNVLLEMGVTLGSGKQIFPILDAAEQHVDLAPYPFLQEMACMKYHLSPEGIISVVDNVVDRFKADASEVEMLRVAIDGTTKLTIRQKSRVLAVYYPSAIAHLWNPILPKLAALCKTRCELLIVQQRPHRAKARLELFEHLVWSLRRADRALIDTTGDDIPDLYGAFALGFATGISSKGSNRALFRTEMVGHEQRSGMSMWPPERYKVWHNTAELLDIVESLLPREKAAPPLC